jgi:hypothetical protein
VILADFGTTHRAIVRTLDPNGVVVEVPALAPNGLWGPIPTCVSDLAINESVIVSQIGTSRDTLVVIGRVPGRAPTIVEIIDLATTLTALQAADAALAASTSAADAALSVRINANVASIATNSAAIAANAAAIAVCVGRVNDHDGGLADHEMRLKLVEGRIVQPVAFTPAMNVASGGQVDIGTGGTKRGWHGRNGENWLVHYEIVWGTAPYNGGSGDISLALPTVPTGFVLANYYQSITAWLSVPANGTAPLRNWAGIAVYFPTVPGALYPALPKAVGDASVGVYKIATVAATPGGSIPLTEGGYAEGGTLVIEGVLRLEANTRSAIAAAARATGTAPAPRGTTRSTPGVATGLGSAPTPTATHT